MWKVNDGIVSGGESQWQGRVSCGRESVVGESQWWGRISGVESQLQESVWGESVWGESVAGERQ